ncbi:MULTISPECIES: TetR/AcrR family transcriptional regulator [unclassified Oceanobacter]|jgi:AcrR family transcriptional regulator|uniref:TetR/AcrR family transcriptional regulator n=1 Tax=unclassified Oceanobacter TaxID=2620260 RepID=UPI002735C467|nr:MULTISPECIES: TetR/AcrR family transcriptional regulator [unclassified Oceanobacter]MDP2504572.1 TetR/AcrR family transcriptional regulator [Oceanobacter sp. 3_MG-2023]MDP2546975.1 TetR/AcrR family transcriptional regulator [Oceanobacter sp. 4_MG-2023]
MSDEPAPANPRSQRQQNLQPRSEPMQRRSRKRSREIIDITAELLETVGLDDLSTILIAKAVGISVGSLYHYFPNKHAILYAMGQRWLEDVEQALLGIAQLPVETLPLEQLLNKVLERHLKVYKRQKAVLTLVQAMFSVPELRQLDEQHDDLVIHHMAVIFKRMGIQSHIRERERLGRFYLEVSHSVFLVVVHQNPQRARRTLDDLHLCLHALLQHHLPAGHPTL